jgi:hypothetical protein
VKRGMVVAMPHTLKWQIRNGSGIIMERNWNLKFMKGEQIL